MNVVILAGGLGERLWPLSTVNCPKQFLSITSSFSLLQETVKRLGVVEQINLVCNEEHRFLAAEQMRQLNQKCSIILEPVRRNTAASVALVALMQVQRGLGDQPILVLPADHLIEDADTFRSVIGKAIPLAEEGALITFGVEPEYPETGYGYIKGGDCLSDIHAFNIECFVEKPSLETARRYLRDGGYLWNSGMFLFRADSYLDELKTYRPDVLAACESAITGANQDMDFIRIDEEAFKQCPDKSIDHAIMEHTERAIVFPLNVGWSDIGGWSALWRVGEKDESGNVLRGNVVLRDTYNSLIFSKTKLISTLGVENLIIVDMPDGLLVADKDHLTGIKSVLEEVKESGQSDNLLHRVVYRPWGKFETIDAGDGYLVKRITVRPFAKLSMQLHHFRAEHWIVVKGRARVIRGDETYEVNANESTFIPLGTVHCLENPDKEDLEMIEIQSGSYLGEDDIVRFQDAYGRI